MAGSFLAMWLPQGYTDPVRGPFEVLLTPLSSWLADAGHEAREGVRDLTWSAADAETQRRQEERLRQLEREVQVRRQREAELIARYAQATGLREQWLGPRGRLIPAEVLLRDAVSMRESFLIDRPPDFEPRAQWAVSRMFIDRGRDSELPEDRWAIVDLSTARGAGQLAGGVLVGSVERAGQVTARVRLLTDPDSAVIGQVVYADTNRTGPTLTVYGGGPGQLIGKHLAQPPAREGTRKRDAAPVAAGDWIVSGPTAANLPGPVTIGRVTDVRISDQNAQVYELSIRPAVDYSILRSVWVVDPVSSAAPPAGGGR